MNIASSGQGGAAPSRSIGRIAAAAQRAKAQPLRLAALLNGLMVDGTMQRPGVRSALQPFMKLPKGEPLRSVRTRMAAEIARAVSAFGCVTQQNLEDAGFTAREIRKHFKDAVRAARVTEMVA